VAPVHTRVWSRVGSPKTLAERGSARGPVRPDREASPAVIETLFGW